MTVRKRKIAKKRGGCFGLLFFLLVIALAASAGAGYWLINTPYGPDPEGSDNATFVEIHQGSTTGQIAHVLSDAGIVRSPLAFKLARWINTNPQAKLKAGEYRFDHPATPAEVFERIAHGDVYTVTVTIPEGSNVFDIAAILERNHFTTRAEFLSVVREQRHLISDLDPQASTVEGYLFPDTYKFARKDSADQIVALMVKRFRSVTAPLGFADSSASVHRVVTLASLIEKETAVDSDRPLVASVFENRLAKNMPLMTDPSIIYGLEVAGIWRGTIYASDLKRDTPYNTYIHAGLPPGPVANPGLHSLRAALNPAQSNYLYFVAAGANAQGGSHFSATLSEHNRAVDDYRRAMHKAGSR
jgi:UPF0755 protein